MRHDDLEAELLNSVCKDDVQTEPVLQDITEEVLYPGANKSAGVRLDIHARGIWEQCSSAFFDVKVCHPNADTYIHHSTKQIHTITEYKRKVVQPPPPPPPPPPFISKPIM